MGPLAGPSLGPVIGGALGQSLGWRSIFWFLAIFAGSFTVFLVLFLPETLRSIVGNGSVRATSIWHIRIIELCIGQRKKSAEDGEDLEARSVVSQRSTLAEKKRTNLLESFKIFFQKDVALILFIPSIHYMVYIMSICASSCRANVVTTSTPPLFSEHYHLDELHIGLTYLAIGIGTLIGSLGWGKLLDRDWRIVEKKWLDKGNKKPGSATDLRNFPCEVARTRSTWYPLVLFWVCCAAYGWTIQYDVYIAVPLLFQVFIGASAVSIMSSFQALLLDLHPGRSASAVASVLPSLCLSSRTNGEAEYSEMLAGGRGKCCYATHVDEIECRVDVYYSRVVMLRDEYTVGIGGEEMGYEVERRTRGKITEKEIGKRIGCRAC